MAYTPSCMHMALLQALRILLLASMIVPGPGSAEEAPSGYRIELIHDDANDSFTREELISRAVDRAHLREAMLSATDGTNSPASSGTYSVAAVRSHHEYLMKLKIGPEPFLAVADTGSDLVWTRQLKLCASSTFTHGSCADSCPDGDGPCNCKSCPAGAMCGTCCNGLCMFNKTYGSGKKTAKGFMGNETLTLSTDKNVSIAFGCALNWTDGLMPKSAHGIVGLNRGNMSLVKQLKITKFSYCLNNQFQPKQSSQLWLGDFGLSAGGESSSPLNTTSLVQISPEHTSLSANMYYVELGGISIGSQKRTPLENHFQYKSTDGKGVMFVDSGCSRTKLEKPVFGELKKLLAEDLGESIPITKNNKVHTCFKAAPSKPPLVLHFTNGAQMHLPWDNYMVRLKDHPEFCLAINETEAISILGNFQQQNIHMRYDLTEGHEKLSFVKVDDCSNI